MNHENWEIAAGISDGKCNKALAGMNMKRPAAEYVPWKETAGNAAVFSRLLVCAGTRSLEKTARETRSWNRVPGSRQVWEKFIQITNEQLTVSAEESENPDAANEVTEKLTKNHVITCVLQTFSVCLHSLLGREQFHGLGSMYCRSASAIILTYDVCNNQSLVELEDRFLGLTDTASDDCIFALVGNKIDLTDDYEAEGESEGEKPRRGSASKVRKQVHNEDAIALYKRIMKYRMVDETHTPAADKMCFETSAKTGYNVDFLFESVFNMVIPLIVKKKANGPDDTVILTQNHHEKKTKSGCC
ncbi:ras-related protein Rab-20-like [Bufo gargarizans]|uniref:ras-related protein Rab-20-like n=1 Tax=Bufo gargarizans TaxID=30331 RepID=UPI001CF37C3D|nr:ras-related protein Rab-20-like [Bufo gargarizans]